MLRIVALGIESCFYDMSYTQLAQFFLSEAKTKEFGLVPKRPSSGAPWPGAT
ncbi:MAG: hypothetical protein ABSD38_10595 [Syntrophorhabdales bacterium]|jgi:hypothetical protein